MFDTIVTRLAVNNMQYLSNVLGIKDPIHKQKLALKAMDVVLFGPPKGKHITIIINFIFYRFRWKVFGEKRFSSLNQNLLLGLFSSAIFDPNWNNLNKNTCCCFFGLKLFLELILFNSLQHLVQSGNKFNILYFVEALGPISEEKINFEKDYF